MSEHWLDMKKVFPGLQGQILHTVWKVDVDELTRHLEQIDFKVYIIDGSKVVNEKSFFAVVAKVFEFPAYFGHGWASWDDSLGDFGSLAPHRVAIIWVHADQSFAGDARTFLQAVIDIYNMAVGEQLQTTGHPEEGKKPKQIEIFLHGEAQGFHTVIDLKSLK
jgi:RNAse (barnase) inhibitor barstar